MKHLIFTLLCLACASCISSAPIVPETPANQAQIASCQSTASLHNGIVLGDFVFGGSAAGVGAVGALVTDSGQKTALLVTGAILGGLTTIGTAIAGYTASNFANSKCSDVVGGLPLGSKAPEAK